MKVFYAREDAPRLFEECSRELDGLEDPDIGDLLMWVTDNKGWNFPRLYVIDGVLHIRGHNDRGHWCQFRFDGLVLDDIDLLALEKLNVSLTDSMITGSNLWECIQ